MIGDKKTLEIPAAKAVSEAMAFGIDISLLESNLRLSPQERLERHGSALELVQELERAGNHQSKV